MEEEEVMVRVRPWRCYVEEEVCAACVCTYLRVLVE